MVDDDRRLHPPWPWRSDPGSAFNTVATFARLAAGFDAQLYGVDDSEYIADPDLIGRDLTLVLVMAMRRARKAGIELDPENLLALAQVEVKRWEQKQTQPRLPSR